MMFKPNASEPQTTASRRADRRQLETIAQFRSGTKRANVALRDVSTLGARVAGVFLVHKDDRMWLKLPGLEAIEARVAWVTDFEFGCEFLRPIAQYVVDSVVCAR